MRLLCRSVMYVLVAKIFFDLEGVEHDAVFYRRLAAKIRGRHRVCVQIYGEDAHAVLALTSLSALPNNLHQLYEQVVALCEREGLGRIHAGAKPLITAIDRLS